MRVHRFPRRCQRHRLVDRETADVAAATWRLVAGKTSITKPVPPESMTVRLPAYEPSTTRLLRLPVIAGVIHPSCQCADCVPYAAAATQPDDAMFYVARLIIRCPYCERFHSHLWELRGLHVEIRESKCEEQSLDYAIRPYWPNEAGYHLHTFCPLPGVIHWPNDGSSLEVVQ